ncbi:Sodium/calcium exchanger 3 [Tetrabaena socialis]|uniref:Sodium/calcium exchanger 3 n=1 Tax=Tetrabaena socialis TaxID=47790 RepID=A0A2J7ZRR9_9CHLO|nr:Sodium/calcium exchanger 3 [Tetrabaena socialis]|eukprot:PNH02971.1 Sodium/calcium exchanger 3 [Tetrabaena socialis]
MASAAAQALLAQLEDLLPACIDGGTGPCLETATSGRGYAIFTRSTDPICESDILLPGFNLLPRWLLGALYLLFLLYLFAGVAIASDLFMDGIIKITDTTHKVKRKNANGEIVIVEEKVWNWVVANISLMALGTSSPEIMLAVVEALLTLDKPAGELGPACIAGSAAYNFLIITAVCTTCIPDGHFKKISQLRVYVCTAAWSLWAYIWMLVVYVWWTPDEVTLEEALLTLAFFGLMVLNAWIVDKQPWNKKRNKVNASFASDKPRDLEGAASGTHSLPAGSARHSEVDAAPGEGGDSPVKTLAHYRHILAARQRKGHKKRTSLSHAYSVLESAGVVKVAVLRRAAEGGSLDAALRVHFKTEDGDAVAGLDYVVGGGIIDDDMSEPDVTFSILLVSAESPVGVADVVIVQDRVRVTVVDDDDAGVIGFELPEYEIAFNEKKTFAEVTLVRRRGADGRVQVDYETQDLTAISGEDYVAVHGTIFFDSGEKTQQIRVDLLPSFVPETHKALKLVLTNADGGAELGKRSTCKVTLVRRQLTQVLGSMAAKEGMELRAMADGSFKAGPPEAAAAEDEPYNVWPEWKAQIKVLLFIMVPPADWKGGYPCFFAALGSIVGIVYLVNEAGSLFGCVIGLSEVMVGVSIIAVGTSLPDTMASRIAAVKDKDADAAIGNITGSNGVNVFLGLGVPWTICAIYYKVKGEKYIAKGGDLEFAILLYAIFGGCAIVALAVARRFGGELGGSKKRQYSIAALMVSLWLLFLLLIGLRSYNNLG